MNATFYTHKTGINNHYWTFTVTIDGDQVKTKPLIYRMYSKEKTAINNALKIIANKTIKH